MQDILDAAISAEAGGHSASAFELFKRVIEIEPGRDSAFYRAATHLLEVGRITEAETIFNKIRRNAAPKPWMIERFLGRLRLLQFRAVEAEAHFRHACELEPASAMPVIFLADLLQRLERFKEAEDVLLGALTLTDVREEVYLNLALVKRATGDYVAARDYFEKALTIDLDYPDAKRGLADVEFFLEFIKRQPPTA